MYPSFLFAAIHYLKPSPTFSIRPRSSVGRVTVDLILRSGFDSHRGQNMFFFTSSGSLIPFTWANAQWVFHGFHRSTLKCHCDKISHFFFPLFFKQNNLRSCTMSFRPKRKKLKRLTSLKFRKVKFFSLEK